MIWTRSRAGVAVSVLALLAACGSSSPHNPPAKVTLDGRVTAGPTCPVERPDNPCPAAPVSGRIEARDVANNVIASEAIGADGSYGFSLQPGRYTLHVVVGAVLPRCSDTPATVQPDETTHVAITCDSGIR